MSVGLSIGFFLYGGHIELVIESWSYIPSGYVKIAIENGHRNRGFSQKNGGSFHSYVNLPECKSGWKAQFAVSWPSFPTTG